MVALNSAVALISLGVALWLGLYIITRSRRRTAWLAAGTLWALVGYFLNRLVNLNFTDYGGVAFLGGWSAVWAAPFWYHLSIEFQPRAPGRRWLWPLGYGLAALFYVLMTETSLVFEDRGSVPAVTGFDTVPGPLYPALALFLLGWGSLGWWNLWTARRTSPPLVRGQLAAMVRATGVALAGALYLIIIDQFRIPLPAIFGDTALGVAVGMMGYAMARYNALLEGRSASADLRYGAAAIGLVALSYFLVTWLYFTLYGIVLVAFVPVLMLVIISHTLYDGFRSQLDRLFYRRTSAQLRDSLRVLAREAGTADALEPALRETLVAACDSLKTDRGLVALRRETGLTVAASLRAGAPDLTLAEFDIPEDATLLTSPPPGLEGLAAIAPLVWSGETLGCIAVGPRPGGYRGSDLLFLADIADRIAGVVYAARATETATSQLNAQMDQYRAREQELQRQVQGLTAPGSGGLNEPQMTRQVEDALRHLHDFVYLGEHRLASLPTVETLLAEQDAASVTIIERGQALRDILVRTIERLRPTGAEPRGDAAAGRREWHPYLILRESYIEDVPTRDTMTRLLLSEGTYNRQRRQALRAVALALTEDAPVTSVMPGTA